MLIALLTLQSQEILNRPVFVLDILKKSEQILNILNIDRKFWTDSEHSEHWLNRVWTLSEMSEHSEQCLNRFWTFWTLTENSEHSEHCLKSLNRFWTFWTLSEKSEQSLNIWTLSEQSLNIFTKYIMRYFNY